jgi:hypothetical protein
MAILALFSSPTMSKEQYDALRREIGWETSPAPGGIFHVAGFGDQGGIHVADVWESAEALNQFVSSRLMPAMQKLNAAAPTVEVYPVHNANAFAAIDAFKVKGAAKAKPKAKAKAKAKGKKRK